MRRILRGGLVISALAGTFLLAAAPAVMAEPSTQSPEGIGIEANGTGTGFVTISSTPDATSTTPSPSSVGEVTVGAILNAHTLNAAVSGNTTTASVQSLDTTGLTPLLGAISAGVITSSCTANSGGGFTETATVAGLSILGGSFTSGTPTVNDVLTLNPTLLPEGITSVTVTLNEQVTGPVTGSETVNAVHIAIVTPLETQDIYIASSTCGPYNADVPVASGKGLAIGLGALGVVGLGAGATSWYRRRRTTGA
ncbi:MAG TPA: choice-of-anchor P family protein [Streptosporangiaceae bacterium]|nr:choice-of-anchor P family protein [Streptosporangiaceae bacterium]